MHLSRIHNISTTDFATRTTSSYIIMSSSTWKVGDKVWVKSDSGVEELATIVKLPPNNTTKYDTKEYNNKEHNNDGNNNSTTITDSLVDSDKPKEIAVKSEEATVSSNLTEYSRVDHPSNLITSCAPE